jgi:hypothetical protein
LKFSKLAILLAAWAAVTNFLSGQCAFSGWTLALYPGFLRWLQMTILNILDFFFLCAIWVAANEKWLGQMHENILKRPRRHSGKFWLDRANTRKRF